MSEELEKARPLAPGLARVVYWGGGGPDSLEALMADASPRFEAVETAADDVCLIAFTSGTTGEPKGTMHFHRDLVAICDAYSDNVLRPEPSDRFIGSPPLAFTFGLGALALFPMHAGAATVLIEKATPDELLPAIARHRATVCVTAPTAYRAMLARLGEHDVSSLRKCVSAGEALPKATFDAWQAATGLKIMDGIGATEMLHIFIAAREDEIRPGATGKPVPGYEAKIVDAEGRDLPPGAVGRLAVRGPTGCRYLADERQRKYVEDGWNLTGDTYLMDEDGYFWYQARSDDMIISAGYNIAGPEVEAALLTHPAVAECGVVGAPDPERGMIVKAFVVLSPGERPGPETAKALQDHVKQEIAPYKYPRAIEFVAELPKTATGKLQRFALRQMAQVASKASGGMKRQDRIKGSDLPAGAWRITVPVRFSHCDPAGIVYFPRYFDMINGVVEDWFAGALGLAHHTFIRDRRIGLGPAHAEADFMTPGFLADELVFAVLVERLGNSSLALSVHAHRGEEPVLIARLVIVTTSLDEHRAVPIPDDLRAALERYRERCR